MKKNIALLIAHIIVFCISLCYFDYSFQWIIDYKIENVLIFVVRHYEKNSPSDWRIYAPIVNAPMFEKFSRNQALPIGCVEEKADGEFTVYGKKFARKW